MGMHEETRCLQSNVNVPALILTFRRDGKPFAHLSVAAFP
jgi:hypothetical protein